MLDLQFKHMDYVDMDYEDTEIWKTDLKREHIQYWFGWTSKEAHLYSPDSPVQFAPQMLGSWAVSSLQVRPLVSWKMP